MHEALSVLIHRVRKHLDVIAILGSSAPAVVEDPFRIGMVVSSDAQVFHAVNAEW